MFCIECGADMVQSTEPIKEKYRGIEFTVEGIEHHVCPNCGEYSLSASASRELSKRLAGKFADLNGLLRPDEIRNFRLSLGLSQEDFQQMFGVTGVAASRWETGKCQQSKQTDLLIREAMERRCVAMDLMERAEVGDYCRSANTYCTFAVKPSNEISNLNFEGVEQNA